MSFKLFRPAVVAAALSALALVGCGGGGQSATGTINGATQNATPIVMNGGDAVSIPGTVSTSYTLLTTMSWAATGGGNQQPLALTNANCATVAKTMNPISSVTGTTATSATNGNMSTGNSSWTCVVNVKAPQVTATANYTLQLSTVDDRGLQQTQIQPIQVVPGPASSNSTAAGSAGQNFSVPSGSLATLSCTNPSNSTVQWVQASGINVNLSSTTTPAATFTAPAVTSETPLVFTCRITDSAGTVTTSNVTVTVQAPLKTTLVVGIAGAQTIAPGASVVLSGTSTWANISGAVSSGAPVTYTWSVAPAYQPSVQILAPNNATSTFIVSPSITALTQIPVSLQAVSGNLSSVATVNLLVDPNGALNLSLSPAAQAVLPATAANVTATAIPGVGSTGQVFYKWVQVSGPDVLLGGTTQSTVSFVTPPNTKTTSLGTVGLRVSVGFQPITSSYPGIATADAYIFLATTP